MAAVHAPRRSRGGTSRRLPQRIRLPVQQAPLTQPRTTVLPSSRACRRPRPGRLPRTGRAIRAEKHAALTTRPKRPSTEPGPRPRRETLASITSAAASRLRRIALFAHILWGLIFLGGMQAVIVVRAYPLDHDLDDFSFDLCTVGFWR